MTFIIPIVSSVVSLLLGTALGLGVALRRQRRARRRAEDIIAAAEEEAERIRREKLLRAQEEIRALQEKEEERLRRREQELSAAEERLLARENRLRKRESQLESLEELLRQQEAEVRRLLERGRKLLEEEEKLLQRLSGFSREEAKEYLLKLVEADAEKHFAQRIAAVEQRFRQDAERLAKEILATAVQRYAAEYAEENTVSTVPLPSEEFKGRIIGREGRNIRTFEALTGVDVLVDDTPDVVVLSSFNPLRREIARLAMEKLIEDGRIHPARIEEKVRRAKERVEDVIREHGERAAFEVGVELPRELIMLLGRLHFRTSYGQNQLQHSLEVSHLSRLIAEELGIDPNVAKRAGLLHDIGKALDQDVEGSHALIGADLARRYGERPLIVNAIAAHHEEAEPASVIAAIVQAADTLSAARPGARRETYERYIQRLRELEDLCRAYPEVAEAYALQAGREVRVVVRPERTSDEMASKLAYDIARQIEEQLQYPGEIKVTVIRQVQYIETAR
ncbi:MAG: ribonuclease Y [Caldiserica bacterium]|nr:ribonuclease Y [Caldisericota bacterium]